MYGHKGSKQLFAVFVCESYLPWARQHHKRHDQDERHATLLCEFFTGRTLQQITRMSVEGFKLKRAATPTKHDGERSPRTVNSELTTLSAILRLAVTHRLLRENPCHGISWLPAEECQVWRLTADEEMSLLASAEAETPYLKPMIQLALWTGFRQGELIRLTKQAVDFGRGRIYVDDTKWARDPRKTEGVPMGRDARALLSRLCAEAMGDLLFANADGRPLARQTVNWHFMRARKRAGVVDFRFHDLRHEYGSRLGDADVNLKKIARLMGHSKTKQTERYVHPSDDGLLAATEVAAQATRARIVPVGRTQTG